MILFKNGFISLYFEPASDILSFGMPHVDSVVMPEMKRSLDIIVEHTRNYDVKRILLDARNTDIGVEEADYAEIIATFYQNLARTRVQRIARLVQPDSKREHLIKKVLDVARLPMEVHAFSEEVSARTWLLEAKHD